MSETEQAAAKWAVVEEYRKAKANLAVLKTRLEQWGRELAKLGEALQHNPSGIEIPSSLPEQAELQRVVADCKKAELAYGQSSARLQELGLEPF